MSALYDTGPGNVPETCMRLFEWSVPVSNR